MVFFKRPTKQLQLCLYYFVTEIFWHILLDYLSQIPVPKIRVFLTKSVHL